ncbi:MAG: DUF4249 domain-containing protein [Bacteroidetes bacterium]|nr:DUF4249 domain-containing protein [Bacteroidota bacterium]
MKKFIFLPALLVFLLSCQKDIKIKQVVSEEQLSIECILYPGKVPQVFLSRSIAFFDHNTSPSSLFARNATVSITGSSTDNLIADSAFDNFRCRWAPFYKGVLPAQAGQSYTLTVSYNGKTYTATTSIDQAKINIASSTYAPSFHDIYGDHEGVIVNFKDAPGQENFYRYQMHRLADSSVYGGSNLGLIHSTCINNGWYFLNEIGRSVFYDKNLDGQELKIVIEPAYTHQQDDTAYIFIQSLDKNSAEFYDNLDKQKLAQLNPFVEPVFLKTKIEGCIGVFGSAVISDSVKFVYPE